MSSEKGKEQRLRKCQHLGMEKKGEDKKSKGMSGKENFIYMCVWDIFFFFFSRKPKEGRVSVSRRRRFTSSNARQNENQTKKSYGDGNWESLGAWRGIFCVLRRQKGTTQAWTFCGHCRVGSWEHRLCFEERWLRLKALGDDWIKERFTRSSLVV